MFRRTMVLGCVAAFGLWTAAVGQTAPTQAVKPNSDLRCLIIANALGQSKDQRQRQEVRLMMIFYLGRIDARTPNLPLAPALQAQDALIRVAPPTAQQAQAQVRACVATYEGRMKALGALMRPPAGGAAPQPAMPKGPAQPPAPL